MCGIVQWFFSLHILGRKQVNRSTPFNCLKTITQLQFCQTYCIFLYVFLYGCSTHSCIGRDRHLQGSVFYCSAQKLTMYKEKLNYLHCSGNCFPKKRKSTRKKIVRPVPPKNCMGNLQQLVRKVIQKIYFTRRGVGVSTLDFHFLSHYSYIKSNHWAHLLATNIPYVQDSAR